MKAVTNKRAARSKVRVTAPACAVKPLCSAITSIRPLLPSVAEHLLRAEDTLRVVARISERGDLPALTVELRSALVVVNTAFAHLAQVQQLIKTRPSGESDRAPQKGIKYGTAEGTHAAS
jgi:hypothetical protein